MPLHFGYGSNISWAKLRADMERPLGAAPPAPGELDAGRPAHIRGYRLGVRAANGTATIVPTRNPEDRVYGVLYYLNESQFERLQLNEGLSSPLIEVETYSAEGTAVALSWIWPESDDPEQPVARYYIELMIEAGRARGVPAEYLDGVLAPLARQRARFKAF